MSFNHRAIGFDYCKADIIAKGVIDGVGGFGVDYKKFGGVHVRSFPSFDKLIIHYKFAFVNRKIKKFRNFLRPGKVHQWWTICLR